MSISQLNIDIDSGWHDEVGSSICNYVKTAGYRLNQAIIMLGSIINQAEQLINQNIEYKSHAHEINALRID